MLIMKEKNHKISPRKKIIEKHCYAMSKTSSLAARIIGFETYTQKVLKLRENCILVLLTSPFLKCHWLLSFPSMLPLKLDRHKDDRQKKNKKKNKPQSNLGPVLL